MPVNNALSGPLLQVWVTSVEPSWLVSLRLTIPTRGLPPLHQRLVRTVLHAPDREHPSTLQLDVFLMSHARLNYSQPHVIISLTQVLQTSAFQIGRMIPRFASYSRLKFCRTWSHDEPEH